MRGAGERKPMKREHILTITQGAVVAALYVALTVVFAPISFGAMQVRVSEVLTVLPMFTPAAVPGLFIGCILANVLGGAVIWDTIFGSRSSKTSVIWEQMASSLVLPPCSARVRPIRKSSGN